VIYLNDSVMKKRSERR